MLSLSVVGCNVDYTIPDCGSVDVQSPNYPANYRNLESCQWLLNTEADRPIRITIEEFSTEPEFDKVFIGNGVNPANTASQIAGPLSGSLALLDTKIFTSQGAEMWITFTTDNNKVNTGFSMRVEDAGCISKYTVNLSQIIHHTLLQEVFW